MRRVLKKTRMAAAASGLGTIPWTLLILKRLRSFLGERKLRFVSGDMWGVVWINDRRSPLELRRCGVLVVSLSSFGMAAASVIITHMKNTVKADQLVGNLRGIMGYRR